MADGIQQSPEQGAPATDTASDDAKKLKRRKARQTWLLRFLLVVIIIAGGVTAWYFLVGRNTVSTDNAYVSAETADITPLMSATVTEITVSNTDQVKKGDILIRLDPANAEIEVAEAEASLAAAQRRFRQTEAQSKALSSQVSARLADVGQARAMFDSAKASYEEARVNYERREALADSGAVSADEITAAKKDFDAAKAALTQAQAAVRQAEASHTAAIGQLNANQSLIDDTTIDTAPDVLAAKAKLASAKLDLSHAVITAPIDGVVAQRRVQVGQRVNIGAPVMSIVPLDRVYIDANFKEGQLTRVKTGMAATITADIYGDDVVYHGRVAGLSGATGSSMALIPAQNATGNWIKVVQRLPVRIELDPKELAEHPLRVGLSTEVTIHLNGD